jgi:hypothetical protein
MDINMRFILYYYRSNIEELKLSCTCSMNKEGKYSLKVRRWICEEEIS